MIALGAAACLVGVPLRMYVAPALDVHCRP